MLAKRIIPCLDIADGRVVKGVKFVELRDAGDPVEAARAYEKQGADELTFLDITASHENRDTIVEVVRAVARQVFMPLTVGGGVRESADVRKLLKAGADKVSINTAAVENPDLLNATSEQFGSQCIVLAIDARKNEDDNGWTVFTHGGRTPTAHDAVNWAIEGVERGAGEILLTSMDRDGTKGRVRSRTHQEYRRIGIRPCYCIGRCRYIEPPLRGSRGRKSRCSTCRIDFSLR